MDSLESTNPYDRYLTERRYLAPPIKARGHKKSFKVWDSIVEFIEGRKVREAGTVPIKFSLDKGEVQRTPVQVQKPQRQLSWFSPTPVDWEARGIDPWT
jgi:hypothetical protein